jgi:hypothetical protein
VGLYREQRRDAPSSAPLSSVRRAGVLAQSYSRGYVQRQRGLPQYQSARAGSGVMHRAAEYPTHLAHTYHAAIVQPGHRGEDQDDR